MTESATPHEQPTRPLHETEYATEIDESVDSSIAHNANERPHTTSLGLMIGMLVLLFILTAINYWLTFVDFGSANIWVTLAIAVIKAGIVGAFFMHLWWDAPFNGFIVFVALFFIVLFIGVSLLDIHQTQPNTIPPTTAASTR